MTPTSLEFMREKRAHEHESIPRRVPGILKMLDKSPFSLNFFHCILPFLRLLNEWFYYLLWLCLISPFSSFVLYIAWAADPSGTHFPSTQSSTSVLRVRVRFRQRKAMAGDCRGGVGHFLWLWYWLHVLVMVKVSCHFRLRDSTSFSFLVPESLAFCWLP